MKLTSHFNVFLASMFNRVCQRVVCAMRSFGSMPNGCINHACPKGKHTRLSAYGQCSKRDRHFMPLMSRALTNLFAACFIHAAALGYTIAATEAYWRLLTPIQLTWSHPFIFCVFYGLTLFCF